MSAAHDDASHMTDISNNNNSAVSWNYGQDQLSCLTSAADSKPTQGWIYDAGDSRLTRVGMAAGTCASR
jgi:hypothetical protein